MTTVTGTARISLASGSVPVTRTGHSITIRARKTNVAHTAAIGVLLFEGSNQRTTAELTQSLTASLTDYTLAISDSDAAAITSYADLELRIRGFSTTNDLATFEVARVTLNIPVSGGFTVPTVPQSLVATAGNSQVALTWSAPASNGGSAILSYQIYRSTTPDNEVLIADTGGTGTSYTDSTAVNGTLYYYRVSALNAVGYGAWGNEVSATPAAPVVPAPVLTPRRFYGPALLGNAASTIYLCPAFTTTVIRHIHVSNPSNSPVEFTFSIGTSSSATRLWDAQPIAARDFIDHLVEHSLTDGEIIQAYASLDATLNLTVDGYEFSTGPIYPSDSLYPHD